VTDFSRSQTLNRFKRIEFFLKFVKKHLRERLVKRF
jgi:hypothetical protein